MARAVAGKGSVAVAPPSFVTATMLAANPVISSGETATMGSFTRSAPRAGSRPNSVPDADTVKPACRPFSFAADSAPSGSLRHDKNPDPNSSQTWPPHTPITSSMTTSACPPRSTRSTERAFTDRAGTASSVIPSSSIPIWCTDK